jgi:hypothetical protein
MDVYRERAHLLAYLATHNPSALVFAGDPAEPDWPILFVETPEGQMCWHTAPADVGLFDHVTQYDATKSARYPAWDGHTTEEKYERLARHVATLVEEAD